MLPKAGDIIALNFHGYIDVFYAMYLNPDEEEDNSFWVWDFNYGLQLLYYGNYQIEVIA